MIGSIINKLNIFKKKKGGFVTTEMINITKQFEYVLYKWYDWLVYVDDNLISWCQKIACHTPQVSIKP